MLHAAAQQCKNIVRCELNVQHSSNVIVAFRQQAVHSESKFVLKCMLVAKLLAWDLSSSNLSLKDTPQSYRLLTIVKHSSFGQASTARAIGGREVAEEEVLRSNILRLQWSGVPPASGIHS
jgi:hypothetical protein